MIQIRKNVFETNSSSSHSLIMLKEDKPLPQFVEPGYYLDVDGKLYLWDNDLEFGRSPFALLTDWYHRLCYAIAAADDDVELDVLEEICYSRIPGFRGFKFPRNGWYDPDKDDPSEEFSHGYIDHQSIGVLEGFLSRNDISIEDFIFNDRYIVVIDGDEYNVFDTMRSLPTWNQDAVQAMSGAYDDDTDQE